MPVKLIIKSAAQCVDDFALTCEMTWTIAEVKNQISVLYPNKPKREQQKLIYGGKLLPDDLTLKSILNQVQDVYVMHLVCPLPPAPESEKKNINKGNSIPPVYTAPPPLNPNNMYGQMNQPLLTPTDLSSGMPPFANAFTAYPGPDVTRQYMAMQQMYTQFMTQYFSQYNSNMPYGPAPSATPVQQPQNNVPQQNAAPNVIPRQPEEQEDYIDYLYAFVRVLILSTLLIYYSSFARVVSVTVMLVLFTMFVRMNRRQQMLRENARRAAENAAQQQRAESSNAENNDSEDSPNTESTAAETPSQTQNPPANPSVPSTIITLVTAFFSSLIPSDPLPVNVN